MDSSQSPTRVDAEQRLAEIEHEYWQAAPELIPVLVQLWKISRRLRTLRGEGDQLTRYYRLPWISVEMPVSLFCGYSKFLDVSAHNVLAVLERAFPKIFQESGAPDVRERAHEAGWPE